MGIHHGAQMICAAALALAFFSATAHAQQPSAVAVATAKEVINVKGAHALWDPIVPGIVEKVRRTFVQANPMLIKDINEVAAKLRSEFAPRGGELIDQAAKFYAMRFTEAELKDMLAFYKSRLGQKMIKEEPAVLDQTMKNADAWAEKFADAVIAKMRTEMKRRGHDL
jgi:hypothetical protein